MKGGLILIDRVKIASRAVKLNDAVDEVHLVSIVSAVVLSFLTKLNDEHEQRSQDHLYDYSEQECLHKGGVVPNVDTLVPGCVLEAIGFVSDFS